MSEFVELDLVCVLLRRVGPRVPHKRLERHEVPAALAQKSVCEAVPQLMRGQTPNASALAYAPDHPHQSLVARLPLRILPASLARVRRYPLLDLDREYVIVQLGLELPEACTQLVDDVRIERQPVPMLTLPMHTGAAANEVEVGPPTADDFRPP